MTDDPTVWTRAAAATRTTLTGVIAVPIADPGRPQLLQGSAAAVWCQLEEPATRDELVARATAETADAVDAGVVGEALSLLAAGGLVVTTPT